MTLSSNASYTARLKLAVGTRSEQRHVWSILQEIAGLDQNPSLDRSTTVHDVLLYLKDLTLREVLRKGAGNINDFDGLDFTALHWSVMRLDLPKVKVLLKAGANVNITTVAQKWSALHLACMQSSPEISAALIEARAELDQEDHRSQTPFHYIPITTESLIDLLLAHGADAKHEDYYGNSVLHTMAWRKFPHPPRKICEEQDGMGTINKLVSLGVGLNVENASGKTPFTLLAMRNVSVLYRTDEGSLPLGDFICPYSGRNLLHYAAYYWDDRSANKVVQGEADSIFGAVEFDADAPDLNGLTQLDAFEYGMFVTDDERAAGVFRPTRKEVCMFVLRLVECREASWEYGVYLATKQQLLEDGTHEKMKAWLEQVGRLNWRFLYDSSLWQVTDPCWRNITQPYILRYRPKLRDDRQLEDYLGSEFA